MFVALNSGFYNSLRVGWSASLSSSSSTTSIMSTFPKEYTCFLFLRLVGERRFESQQNSQRICKTATRRLWIKTCKNFALHARYLLWSFYNLWKQYFFITYTKLLRHRNDIPLGSTSAISCTSSGIPISWGYFSSYHTRSSAPTEISLKAR